MELQITKREFQPLAIENYNEIKSTVQSIASLYVNMVYTEDSFVQAKKDKATINKIIKMLEDRRKEVKKACMKPYESLEQQVKELVAICDQPVKAIDEFVKSVERQKKAEKQSEIEKLFVDTRHPEWLQLEQIMNPKWLNASVSMATVCNELGDRLTVIESDIKTISTLEFNFEAVEVYKQTLDINRAVAEGQRLLALQKRKQEAEVAKLKEESACQDKPIDEEAYDSQPCDSQPDPAPKQTAHNKQWIKFAALLSKDDAVALKAFCNSNDIQLRAILI